MELCRELLLLVSLGGGAVQMLAGHAASAQPCGRRCLRWQAGILRAMMDV